MNRDCGCGILGLGLFVPRSDATHTRRYKRLGLMPDGLTAEDGSEAPAKSKIYQALNPERLAADQGAAEEAKTVVCLGCVVLGLCCAWAVL